MRTTFWIVFLVLLTATACSTSSDDGKGDVNFADQTIVPLDQYSPNNDAVDLVEDEGSPDTVVPDEMALDLVEVEEVEADLCQPDCVDRECGPDGCGSECGSCIVGTICLDEGVCVPPPKVPVTGDLVITEMLINPKAVDDTDGEWFEIRNTTGESVSLEGVSLRDDGGDFFSVDKTIQIGPNKHFVFGRHIEKSLNGGAKVHLAVENFDLSNTSDEIILQYNGVELDRVAWDESWTIPDGASLALAPEYQNILDNNDKENWCASTLPIYDPAGDLGTPGTINPDCAGEVCVPACDGKECGADGCGGSCGACPMTKQCIAGLCVSGGELPGVGDVIVNEFMFNPKSSQDTNGEYIEIWNTTPKDLLLANMIVRDNDGDAFTIQGSLVLGAYGYLVLGRNADPEMNGGVEVDYVYSGFTMANNGDEIILELDGTVIDSVAYVLDLWPLPEGKALVLDPWVADWELNDDPMAWCPATVLLPMGDFGSPGAENEECPML